MRWSGCAGAGWSMRAFFPYYTSYWKINHDDYFFIRSKDLTTSCNFCPFGVLKKSESESECESNREHSRLFFLTLTHTLTLKIFLSLHIVSQLLFSVYKPLNLRVMFDFCKLDVYQKAKAFWSLKLSHQEFLTRQPMINSDELHLVLC